MYILEFKKKLIFYDKFGLSVTPRINQRGEISLAEVSRKYFEFCSSVQCAQKFNTFVDNTNVYLTRRKTVTFLAPLGTAQIQGYIRKVDALNAGQARIYIFHNNAAPSRVWAKKKFSPFGLRAKFGLRK